MAAPNDTVSIQTGLTRAQQHRRFLLSQDLKAEFPGVDDRGFDDYVDICSKKVRQWLWEDGGTAWTVNVDWYLDEVHKAVWFFLHRHYQAPAKPLLYVGATKKFGSPFSRDLLEWCYNQALDEKKQYMLARGDFDNISDYQLRSRDRMLMYKSGQVGGLVHDAHICPQFGMIWIPQVERVSFESCVGANADQIKAMLGEAEKLVCGPNLVLAHGVLPNNGHRALVLEFADGADGKSPVVWADYKRAFLDLLEWQMRLLVEQRPVKLAGFLRDTMMTRLGTEFQVQSAPVPREKRTALVRRYWASIESALLAAQQAAITAGVHEQGRYLTTPV
ncbi:hypothetical protein PG985_014791 [Apiospora marii]|uniref:uncharacterized protein n=1 Tax=Apiospora marii TaxID=335849 RepID=UPI00312DFF23